MKHVFVVYSHLTFYIANQIVNSKNIQPDDCLFLLVSNYKLIPKYLNVYKNHIEFSYGGNVSKERYFSGVNIFKTFKNIKKFDCMIEEFTGKEQYVCYIGHCRSDIENLLVSNSNCIGYYIFEEGYGSYADNFYSFSGIKFIIYKLILIRLFSRYYCIKEYNINTSHPKFLGIFATTKRCFPYYNGEKYIIDNPFENVELETCPDVIISIDPFFLYKELNLEVVEKIYSALAKYIINKNYNVIAYKFHPMFDVRMDMKKAYNKLIRQYFGDNLLELDKDVVIENILKTYKCDFYTVWSSIGIYGALSGAKCYSFASLVRQYMPLHINNILKDSLIEIDFSNNSSSDNS